MSTNIQGTPSNGISNTIPNPIFNNKSNILPQQQQQSQGLNSNPCKNPECINAFNTVIAQFSHYQQDYENVKSQKDEINKQKNLVAKLNEAKNQAEKELRQQIDDNQEIQLQVTNLTRENNKLRNLNQQLQRENTDILNENSKQEINQKDIYDKYNKLQQEYQLKCKETEKIYADNRQLQQQIKKMIYSIEDKDYQLLVDNLTIENQYLKKQVGQPGKSYNTGNKINSNLDDQDYRYTTRNDQELHHLKLQNQDYQDEIATLRKRLRTFHEQNQIQLDNKDQELVNLQMDYDKQINLYRKKEREWEQIKYKNEEQIQILQDQLNQYKSQLKVRTTNLKGLSEREKNYQNQIQNLNDERNIEVEQLKIKISNLDQNNITQKQELIKLDNENQALKNELLKYGNNRLGKIKELKEDLENKEEQINYLKSLIKQKSKEANNHDNCQGQISQLLTDNKDLQAIISEKNSLLREKQQEFDQFKENYQDDMINQYQEELDKLKNNYEDQLNKQKSQNQKLKTEIEDLNQIVNDYQNNQNQENENILEQLQEKEQQINDQLSKIKELEKQAFNQQSSQKNTEYLNQQIKQLNEEIDVLKNDISIMIFDLEDKQSTIDTLKKQLTEKGTQSEETQALQIQIGKIQNINKEQQSQNQNLISQLNNNKKTIADLEKDKESLQLIIKQLQQDLKFLQQKTQINMPNNKDKQELKLIKDDLEKKIIYLENRIAQQDKTIQNISNQKSQVELNFNKQLQEKDKDIQILINDAQQRYNSNDELKTAYQIVSQRKNEIDILKSENQQLKDKLNKLDQQTLNQERYGTNSIATEYTFKGSIKENEHQGTINKNEGYFQNNLNQQIMKDPIIDNANNAYISNNNKLNSYSNLNGQNKSEFISTQNQNINQDKVQTFNSNGFQTYNEYQKQSYSPTYTVSYNQSISKGAKNLNQYSPSDLKR